MAIRIVKRSSWASGSGYVPSYSIGFCVAITMNGRPSPCVPPSIVTWFSCIDSSSAACVFGEARLISSTSSRLVKTGPGRNSNSFDFWLKTFTPVTSLGSRSGVNWSRENEQSSERESAFASIVFPTPGKSSMIKCPSLTRQRTPMRRVSSGACTTRARFSVTARRTAEADVAATRSLPASIVFLQEALDLVEHSCRDLLLRRAADGALAGGTHQHDLVLGRVEADVVSGHVVVDDQVHPFVTALRPRSFQAVPPGLRREAYEQLSVPTGPAQLGEHVTGRLERHRPALTVLRPLVLAGLGRPVVGHGRGHHDQVRVRPPEHLACDVLRGGRRDELDSVGRRHAQVRADEGDGSAATLSLFGERDSHPPRRAVADVAHGIERLARAAGGDHHVLARQ